MSIKGTTKELFIGKEEINIFNFFGSKTTLQYSNMKKIEYCFATKIKCGYMNFISRTNEKTSFEFAYKANEPILRAVDYISDNCPDLPMVETEQQEQAFAPTPKENKSGLKCPKCKSHNVDLWSNEANYHIKQKTSVNLNPLHPLTVFNTKEEKKEKKSAAKIGLGIATAGTSLIFTGTKKKAHNEYYCRDCGNRWIGK